MAFHTAYEAVCSTSCSECVKCPNTLFVLSIRLFVFLHSTCVNVNLRFCTRQTGNSVCAVEPIGVNKAKQGENGVQMQYN